MLRQRVEEQFDVERRVAAVEIRDDECGACDGGLGIERVAQVFSVSPLLESQLAAEVFGRDVQSHIVIAEHNDVIDEVFYIVHLMS